MGMPKSENIYIYLTLTSKSFLTVHWKITFLPQIFEFVKTSITVPYT